MAKQARRNPFAFDPIMRKGGPHQKTNKAKRKGEKQQMQRQLNKNSWRCSFMGWFKLFQTVAN